MRVFLLYGGNHILARFASVVISGRCQLMLYDRIEQYESVTFGLEREILIFQRTAIQSYQMTGFTEHRSKLVHNTAIYTTIVMLGSLSDFSQFEFVDATVEHIVQSESISTLQCSRRRHTCTQRNIAGKCCIKSGYFTASFNNLAAHTEYITSPAGTGSVFLVQSKLYIIF